MPSGKTIPDDPQLNEIVDHFKNLFNDPPKSFSAGTQYGTGVYAVFNNGDVLSLDTSSSELGSNYHLLAKIHNENGQTAEYLYYLYVPVDSELEASATLKKDIPAANGQLTRSEVNIDPWQLLKAMNALISPVVEYQLKLTPTEQVAAQLLNDTPEGMLDQLSGR